MGEKKTLGKNEEKLEYSISLFVFVSYFVGLLRTHPVRRRG